MAMSKPQPISVSVVALTCAALHGVVAIVVAPILAMILCSSALGRVEGGLTLEKIMLLAVAAPVLSAAFGFVAGALMAAAHNVFAQEQRRATILVREAPEVQGASVGSMA